MLLYRALVEMKKLFSWGEKLDRSLAPQRQKGAREALIVLSFINLLNFADRYVPSSVKELIKEDLNLTDVETSLPTTGMVIVYMIAAVIFGSLNDQGKIDRRALLAGGVAFWSLATALAGLSQNLAQLVFFRSLVGVGEAAYGTIAAPYLADFFPLHERGAVYGIFYLAIPVGGALGFGIGATVGAAVSWRVAFMVCGAPGLLAAWWVLRLNDPARGGNDLEEPAERATGSPNSGRMQASLEDAKEIVMNKYFVCTVLGLAANNFALGGLADWASSFAVRTLNADIGEAGLVLGGITVVAGIGGKYSRCISCEATRN